MTDQQQTARIDFVKKLLVANGFNPSTHSLVLDKLYRKHLPERHYSVAIFDDEISFTFKTHTRIPHDQPLKPLREFIKLSNQK